LNEQPLIDKLKEQEDDKLTCPPLLPTGFLAGPQLADFTGRTYIGDRRFLLWRHWSWGCEIVSLQADKQIICFFLRLRVFAGIFGLAGSVQQAQQSNHLAEGLNLLQLNLLGPKYASLEVIMKQC